MPQVEYGGDNFEVDEDGFIDAYDHYNENWVQHVKNVEGIEEIIGDLDKHSGAMVMALDVPFMKGTLEI